MEINEFGLRVDIPISRGETNSRGLTAKLSRLVVDGTRELLGAFTFRCRQEEEAVFVHSVGSFVDVDDLLSQHPEQEIRRYPDLDSVRVDSPSQLEFLLSTWNSEILVIFFSDEKGAAEIIASLRRLEPKWWQLSKEGYEAPYIKQLASADPFLFYAPSRSSLEIMGSRTTIKRCFLKLSSMIESGL